VPSNTRLCYPWIVETIGRHSCLPTAGLSGEQPTSTEACQRCLPSLQSLTLSHMSVTRAELGFNLSACSQLSSLNLLFCQLQQIPGPASTTPPSSVVPSLRQLSLWETDSSIIAGLTQLTGLSLGCGHQQAAECLGHVTGLTQLQHLELGSAECDITAEEVLSILTSLQQLASLALNYTLHQPEFDALLTHAPQLTSVTCIGLHLSEDRSASPCSWKELIMKYQDFNAETLACLPTGSLTRLAFYHGAVFPSPCPALEFSSYEMTAPASMPDVVRRSLVNLLRCPAWQQCGPAVHVGLEFGGLGGTHLSPVLCALALLVGKEVSLSLDMPGVAAGASLVQQLGATFGSSLQHLMLQKCDLSPDFWPAVWAHLPGLQQLTVGDGVYGAAGAHELIFFCSRATRPLRLNLGQALHRQVGAHGKLEGLCQLWGVPQVTVTES
jgi:hypothetical protein